MRGIKLAAFTIAMIGLANPAPAQISVDLSSPFPPPPIPSPHPVPGLDDLYGDTARLRQQQQDLDRRLKALEQQQNNRPATILLPPR